MLRMVLQPLLDRFISYYEPKSLGDSCGGRPLHIEVPERHRARHRLGTAFFNGNEMELIVDAPVVRDRISGVVLEDQLRAAGRLAGEEKVGGRERDDRLRGRIRRGKILNEIAKRIEVVVPIKCWCR